MSAKLIVLDINGLLVYKSFTKNNQNTSLNTIKLNSYNVDIRPHYKEFLEFCYTYATVGFLSSTNKMNVDKILKHILTTEQKKNTLFVWSRDRTHFDNTNDNTNCNNSIETIKKLSDVWDNPVVNEYRTFNDTNTLIIDDSAIKLRFNDAKNVLICSTFDNSKPNSKPDTHLIDLVDMIKEKFDAMQD